MSVPGREASAPASFPTLSALLAPMPLELFWAEVWGQGPVHVHGGTDRFAALLPWSTLDDIVRHHSLDASRMRVFRDGNPVRAETLLYPIPGRKPQRNPRPRIGALTRELRQGATLVIDAVDELVTSVGVLAEQLEIELGDPVGVNLYASWEHTRGFGLHWDDHDVLVLQVSGRKRWTVFGATRSAPLADDVENAAPPSGDPLCELELTAGDLLYLPRGHWHYATPLGEPTVHLTIGIYRRTGVDLARWLAEQMKALEVFRRDLPRFGGAETRARHRAELDDALRTLWTSDVIDRFYAADTGLAAPRPHLALPWVATASTLPPDDQAWVRLLVPRGMADGALDRCPATIELHAAKHLIDGDRLLVLRRLADGQWRPLGQLIGASDLGVTPDRAREAVAVLVRDGLVAVEVRP